MFSQACVKNSVYRGCTPHRQTPPMQTPIQTPQPPGQTPLGRHLPADTPDRHPPPSEMAAEAGGTHLTRMHSCLGIFARETQKIILRQVTFNPSEVSLNIG